MDLLEYSKLESVAIADLVTMGKVSPKELAQLFLEAFEKVNPRINAVIEAYFDRIKFLDDKKNL